MPFVACVETTLPSSYDGIVQRTNSAQGKLALRLSSICELHLGTGWSKVIWFIPWPCFSSKEKPLSDSGLWEGHKVDASLV